MIRKTAFFLTLALAIIAASASADNRTDVKVKTISGTLTCLACDLKGYEGINSQCEALGHHHCVRKANGDYVNFLQNDHSEALIAGGGRHNTEIKVTGIYHNQSHTIDVESYEIDGIKTTWCDAHNRMDMCGDPKAVKATE